ncbi:MAG TPA: DUF1588 domain-containing protein [Polyangiaceae bacterium]|nr:DUF1588 domain-containing protein [Polyangiaceae bacterium]
MLDSTKRIQAALGALLLVPLGTLTGCSSEGGIRPGEYSGNDTSSGSTNGPNGATSDASTNGSGGSNSAAGTSTGTGSGNGTTTSGGGTSSVPLPDGTDPVALIPARIRRLSNAEYDATAQALLGSESRPGASFAPDARQAGFTVNDAQRVDTVLIKQLFAAAETLAVEARSRFGELAPCSSPDDAESCAADFIESFGSKAYRRPLASEEADGLLEVYRVGAEGASYEDGIELTLRALLQSAGFLYLTELGDGGQNDDGSISLTPYELANSLSYLVTAGPPDQPLVAAALEGKLGTAEGRIEELLRLRDQARPESDARLVRLIREWLAIDRIETTAKDSNIYTEFDGVKPAMVAESHDFVQAVLEESSGDVRDFLGATWTVTADNGLLDLYDANAEASGRASLPARRGILNQGAFLAVHAHAHESTPVLRGVAIARRLACLDIASPASLNINVVPPVPDPALTTRERFAAHTADPECVQCHRFIDPFGNAFELFDGMGEQRADENGRAIDSSTEISMGSDFDGTYADSNQLAEALANSPTVRSCFARHIFRATVARSDDSVSAAEDAFIQELEAMPAEQQGNVMDTLIAYVSGPLFTHRRLP